MKGAQILVATVALLLLAGLWYRAINTGTGALEDALQALDDFSIAEGALLRDILSARAGTLRNYDPLVGETRALNDAVSRLQASVAGDAPIAAASDRLARLVTQQEQSTERFKSQNALLQNSLAQFALLNARLRAMHPDSLPDRHVSSLAAAMLKLTLDTSPAVVNEVNDRLMEVAIRGDSTTDAAVTRGLLAHARMLVTLLPATDAVLRSLLAGSTNRQQDAIRALALARMDAAELLARRIRYVLFAISLLLVASLIYLGGQLQARACSLRRRANFEHVIATLSTRLIDARPDMTGSHIEAALAQLGGYFGFDRAYFIIETDRRRVVQWCRAGTSMPAGWPDRAMSSANALGNAAGYVSIHDARKLPASSHRDSVLAAGVHGWVCQIGRGGRTLSALGFDALRPGVVRRTCESFSLLRMAHDALVSAFDRERLEADRERLEANLNHARRMETIGALSSGIAHNFNNIVGAILGYTETAQAHVARESRVAANLGEIRRAGERARDLVEQILNFGRRRSVRRARISVDALVAEARSLLDASLPEHVRVFVETRMAATVVSGEPAQLQQVILNVCNNAAQAMDAPGSILIAIDSREIARPLLLRQGRLVPGRYVVISVEDPGRGMDESTLAQVFEPFFTTRLGGNGLGLATVREIVLDHGGALQVESAPGVGTRLEVWLPSLSHIGLSAEPETPRWAGHGETILVFDTDQQRLLRHEELLAALGYEPVGFTDVASAAVAHVADPDRFDAALLCCHVLGPDIVLECAGALRAAAPQLPIILASAATADLGAPALAEIGIKELIHQPLASAEIAGALARCFSNRTIRRIALAS